MERDIFNYWQSSARIHIYQAFGMKVGRWGISWRPISGTVQKTSRVVVVCMKLHNFIISQGSIAVPYIFEEDNEQHRDAPDRSVYFQDDVDTDDIMHRRRIDLQSSFLPYGT
jgi:hypothetical protein